MAGLTAEEATKMIEAAVSAATAPLLQRVRQSDAREEAQRLLETINLPAPAKVRIAERSISKLPDGEFDAGKFREIVVAEAKSEGEYLAALGGGGRVFGMGAGAAPQVELKPEQIAARESAAKQEDAEAIAIFESAFGMSRRGAEFAAKGRAA